MFIAHEDTHRDEDARLFCGDDPVTGEVIHIDGVGRLIAAISCVEGVPSGTQTCWYPDGKKRSMGNVRYGIAIGEWRVWHPNGNLARYTLFHTQGHRVSLQKWNKEGNLMKDRSYPQ